jgi:sugar diacid utilization regulator
MKDLLVESVLEGEGLHKVLTYLQEATGRYITIADYRGKIYARTGGNAGASPDDHYLPLPCAESDDHLFYEPRTRRLFYCTGHGRKNGYIIVDDVDPGEHDIFAEPLEEASLAVKTFFAQAHTAESAENFHIHNLIADLLIRNINIKEIIKQANFCLDLNRLYYVCVMEPEQPLSEREMSLLHAHTKEWLRFNNLDIICTIWDKKYFVFICPTHYHEQTLEVDPGFEKHLANITRHQRDIKAKFGFSVSFGVGQKYPLPKLHRSYQEALIALHLAKLTGKKSFVKHFSDLGVFTLVCQQDVEQLKRFCKKYLGKILDYDREHNKELLFTLRAFFDADLDAREAARRTYIHINTMRYRLRKIEELTNLKLHKIEERANLFIALKLYEVLVATGFLTEE